MTGDQPTPVTAGDGATVLSVAGLRPVFVYSGFRTSSSWFWNKFRNDPLACAYYEPFNQILADLKADSILSVRSNSWRSHHPVEAGYMAEYGALLGQAHGVPLFPKGDQDSDRFVGSAGVEGALDIDIEVYVANLVETAQKRGRIPVLACTRILGRAAGIRNSFDGYHILLIRNLFQQWNSFSGQARFGNDGFLQILLKTTGISHNDEFVSYLSSFFSEEERADFIIWMAESNHDKIFCYFVAFHIYFLMVARRHVDLVVDVNQLARQGSLYQAEVSCIVAAQTRLQIDLGDARESVDYPLHPLGSVEDCQALLRAMIDRLLLSEARDDEDRRFVEGLIADLWEEHARFTAATAGAAEVIAIETARAQDEGRRRAEAESLQAQTSATLAALENESAAKIDAMKARIDGELAEAQSAAAEASSQLEATLQQVARLERGLADERQARATELAEAQSAAAEASSQLAATLQQVARLERELADEGQARATANAAAQAAAALASSRLDTVMRDLARLERARAEQVRSHALALGAANDRIAAAEIALADANTRFAVLQQGQMALARENGRLEGELAVQDEANAARLADAAAVRRDLASRLTRAERALATAEAATAGLRTDLAMQARDHGAALAAADARYAAGVAALVAAHSDVDRLGQAAASLSRELAGLDEQRHALAEQNNELASQRDGLATQMEAAREQAASDVQALHIDIAQLHDHIAWREQQLQQAASLLAAIPDPLAGLSRLLATLVRRVAGEARVAAFADLQAAVAHWQSGAMLPAAPEMPQGGILSLAGNLGVADEAVMHGGFGMVESDGPITSVLRLLALHDRHFIHTAYQAVLGRSPDAEGEAYYLARLRAGVHKLAMLRQLRQSPEGRAFTPGVAGLDRAIRRYRRATLPLVGAIVRLLTGAEGDSAIHRQLRILANELGCLRGEQAALAGAVQLLAVRTDNNHFGSNFELKAEMDDALAAFSNSSAQVHPQSKKVEIAHRQGLAGFFQSRIWGH